MTMNLVAEASDFSDPQGLVDTTIESLRLEVKTEKDRIEREPKYAAAIIDRYLSPHIDLRLTSSLVLRDDWFTATPQQQEGFVTALKELLLRIFAAHIIDYHDAKVTYAPTIYSGHNNQLAVVRSTVSRSGIVPIRVDFRLYNASDVWKVYDVAIVGISLVKTYRLTAKYELSKHSLDEIIAKMNAVTPGKKW